MKYINKCPNDHPLAEHGQPYKCPMFPLSNNHAYF